MEGPQLFPIKQPRTHRSKPSEMTDHGVVTSGAHSPNDAPRRSPRALTRHKVDCVVAKPDVSPEFIQYLKSFTKRDFEHAHATDAEQNLDVFNTTDACVPKERPPTRKTGQTEGFNVSARNAPLANCSYSRPVTAEAGFADENSSVGVHPESSGRNILRPVSASVTSSARGGNGAGGQVFALTKSRTLPYQLGWEAEREAEFDEVARPTTANSIYEDDDSCGSASDSERPCSAASSSSKRVTFASDVVNYDRESKPSKKRKLAKRRRQGFPHPSRGILIPPPAEIIESSGPDGICKDNPYVNYNQVWNHPTDRTTGESCEGLRVRHERFQRLMTDLEHAHIHYNRLTNIKQNDYITQCIFKRYILVIDLALTEGHLNQVEHLLETISKSVPVLHQNTFFYLYGSKTLSERMNDNEESRSETNDQPDLILARYALSRISGSLPRQDSTNMSIETVLVKMCLELIEVVFSKFGSLEYRSALHTLPYTVNQAIALLKDLRNSKDNYGYVKWINNSAVQRDFRSILKNFGLLDIYGSKSDVPTPDIPGITGPKGRRGSKKTSKSKSTKVI